MHPKPSYVALAAARGLIDGVDDALLALLAGRRRAVAFAAGVKRVAGWPGRDPGREREVRLRAQRLGHRLGLPPASSDRLISLLIEDACGQQGLDTATDRLQRVSVDIDQGTPIAGQRILLPTMNRPFAPSTAPSSYKWLRLLPPPARLAPLLRYLPARLQARWLEFAMQRVLAAPLVDGRLDALDSRKLGIEVSDLGLRWVVTLRDGRMHVCAPDEVAEATVRGSATDLLLLASRCEDADTLFFQRRLMLIGDTDLGLTARNLLDQLPWDEVPLGLRIVLHRGGGLARLARAAYRKESAPV